MNVTVRNLLLLLAGILVGTWLLKIVLGWAIGLLLGVVVPLAVVGALVYGGYLLVSKKALGGNRRTLP